MTTQLTPGHDPTPHPRRRAFARALAASTLTVVTGTGALAACSSTGTAPTTQAGSPSGATGSPGGPAIATAPPSGSAPSTSAKDGKANDSGKAITAEVFTKIDFATDLLTVKEVNGVLTSSTFGPPSKMSLKEAAALATRVCNARVGVGSAAGGGTSFASDDKASYVDVAIQGWIDDGAEKAMRAARAAAAACTGFPVDGLTFEIATPPSIPSQATDLADVVVVRLEPEPSSREAQLQPDLSVTSLVMRKGQFIASAAVTGTFSDDEIGALSMMLALRLDEFVSKAQNVAAAYS